VTGVPAELKEAVKLSRGLLSEKFETTFQQYVAADRLLKGKLAPQRRKDVSATFEVVKQNLQRLLTASNVCYERPDRCPTAVNQDLVLIPISEDALLPSTFKTACIAALKLPVDDPLRITVARLVDVVNTSGFTSQSDPQDCDIDARLLAKLPKISLQRLNPEGQAAIVDLSPLGGLTSLQELDITGNQVSDLSDLAFLGELTVLNASNNRISDLAPLEALTQLNEVRLSNNRLKDIGPLARIPKLQEVVLDGNQIEDLTPLTTLLNLGVANLNNNNVSSLECFKKIYRLRTIQIENNLLTDEEAQKFSTAFPSVSLLRH
jgi:Leucine-rich repeat (LRR) protein